MISTVTGNRYLKLEHLKSVSSLAIIRGRTKEGYQYCDGITMTRIQLEVKLCGRSSCQRDNASGPGVEFITVANSCCQYERQWGLCYDCYPNSSDYWDWDLSAWALEYFFEYPRGLCYPNSSDYWVWDLSAWGFERLSSTSTVLTVSHGNFSDRSGDISADFVTGSDKVGVVRSLSVIFAEEIR